MKTSYLKLLSHEELKKIYQASLAILERTGMLIDHPRALELLRGAGAKVDFDKKIVKFPAEVIESKLKILPREITYRGRTPEYDRTLSIDSEIYSRVPGGATNYIDIESGKSRRARIDDWRQFARLVDALPTVASVSTFHCGDIPAQTADIHSLYVLLTEQRKNIVHNAFSTESQKYIIEMALVAAGGKENIRKRSQVRLVLSPISPLYLNHDDTEQLLQACDYGIPVDMPIMPIAGTTAPITLAGTLALANAEYLGTMALAQTAHPGHDMPFFVDPVVADMRTAYACFAAPETGMLIAAISQLGQEIYGMPSEAIGLDSDGFTSWQTAFQKAQNIFMQALAGGKLIIGAGALESTMALCPAQLLIDEEVMNIARRMIRGIKVNDSTLAVDVINHVGPRGHFMLEEHTLEYCHEGELMSMNIFDRCKRDVWENAGSKSLEQKAREIAKHTLAEHTIEPLPANVLNELTEIVKKADMELAE